MKQRWLTQTVPAVALAVVVAEQDDAGYDLTHMAASEPGGFGSKITLVLLFKLREEKTERMPDHLPARVQPTEPWSQPQRRGKQK